MKFTDPNELTVQLSDLDGAVVAIKKIADGATVTRTMDDGRNVTRTPILCRILAHDGEKATAESTLVFPESLIRTIEQAEEYAIGRLAKNDHPTKADYKIWELSTIDAATKALVMDAFIAIG